MECQFLIQLDLTKNPFSSLYILLLYLTKKIKISISVYTKHIQTIIPKIMWHTFLK